MKRLLMLVGVAAVAGAMYVAASPASQQSKFATEKQFLALKKQVATLNKNLKNTTLVADAALGIIADCYLTVGTSTANANGLGVSQLGTASNGFLFGANSATATPRTALDVASSSPTYYLQEVTPDCVAGNLLKHRAVHSGSSLLQRLVNSGR
jgi:hypothetical protein